MRTSLLVLAVLAASCTTTTHTNGHGTGVATTDVSPAASPRATPAVTAAPVASLLPSLRPASRSRSILAAPRLVHRRAARTAPRAAGGRLHDITEYCDTGNRTSSGKWPQPGMVAVIDRSIPFGTRVVIDGLGTYTVEDWIGHGSEFDIFTHSCRDADIFGRQHRRVTIVR